MLVSYRSDKEFQIVKQLLRNSYICSQFLEWNSKLWMPVKNVEGHHFSLPDKSAGHIIPSESMESINWILYCVFISCHRVFGCVWAFFCSLPLRQNTRPVWDACEMQSSIEAHQYPGNEWWCLCLESQCTNQRRWHAGSVLYLPLRGWMLSIAQASSMWSFHHSYWVQSTDGQMQNTLLCSAASWHSNFVIIHWVKTVSAALCLHHLTETFSNLW